MNIVERSFRDFYQHKVENGKGSYFLDGLMRTQKGKQASKFCRSNHHMQYRKIFVKKGVGGFASSL